MNNKRLLLTLTLTIGFIAFFITAYFFLINQSKNTSDSLAATVTPSTTSGQEKIEVLAQNLEIPWEIIQLPGSGDLLVTERSGSLLLVKESISIPIEGVEHIGEGGLLGLTLHPNFSENNWLYLYLTTRTNKGLINRVERYAFQDNSLLDRKVIIDEIPGSRYHDGGRIAFGPNDYLYITTGDAGNPDSAQDIDSLGGKILRLTDTGEIPVDNPFDNPIYSYGHRNHQGLAWDDVGQLWATEHGRSGILSGFDELNMIEKGANYGWPLIQGDETREGMLAPIIHSGSQDTWAPADAVFYNGSIFFAGLRGEALYEYNIANKTFGEHFKNQFGRLRGLLLGNDDYLYLTTSNQDGRGQLREGDDKIIRVKIGEL